MTKKTKPVSLLTIRRDEQLNNLLLCVHKCKNYWVGSWHLRCRIMEVKDDIHNKDAFAYKDEHGLWAWRVPFKPPEDCPYLLEHSIVNV